MKEKILLSLISFVLVLSACGISQPPMSVTAPTLSDAYYSNEIKADEAYKDKVLEVYGGVGLIGRDGKGTAYVILRSGYESLGYDRWGIVCKFDKKHELRLTEIEEGDRVRIEGRCRGLDRSSMPECVVLENCILKRP